MPAKEGIYKIKNPDEVCLGFSAINQPTNTKNYKTVNSIAD